MECHKGSLVSSCPSEAKPEKGAGKREHPRESPKDDKDDPKKLKLGIHPKPSSLPGASSAPKIAIALGAQKIAAPSTFNMKPTSSKLVAKAFNVSDDDEEEEMPAEARMRMRNIGRETPTSAGPNSFGKSKKGFTDYNGLFQKKLNEIAAESEGKTSTSTAVPAPHDKIKK